MDQELIASGWRPPTLLTPRLCLRGLEESDAPRLFEHASNPKMTPYVTWDNHRSIDDSRQFILNHAAEHYLQAVPEPIAVCHRDDPADLVGMVGCTWAARAHQVMELGYWIAEPFWGRGYATEAARALIDWVFSTYTVNRIQAHFMVQNPASGKVMEKLCLQYEGTFRSAVLRHGRFSDVSFYAILRDDWAARK